MTKYDPLYIYLKDSNKFQVTLSFDELERILGFKLPNSAKQHQEWWANEDVNTTRHVHCKSWQNAGYKQTVVHMFVMSGCQFADLKRSYVIFEKVRN